ncbi:MAG: site-2 protease family protein [Candidatus Zixiibacteriota bacterium]
MIDGSNDAEIQTLSALLADLYKIDAVYRRGNRMNLSLTCRHNPEISLSLITDRLKSAGYSFDLVTDAPQLAVGPLVDGSPGPPLNLSQAVLDIDPVPHLRIPPLNIILFALTLLSVYLVPVLNRNGYDIGHTLSDLARGGGLEFTAALMSILFVHEMGHFIAARRRNVITSYPYFIPAPPFISIFGTFGALIKVKSPFWNRRDLLEMGAAGPIAGWVFAIAWLIYGLSHSSLVSIPTEPTREMLFSLDGESIIMRLATLNIIGAALPGQLYQLSEAAFAGWVGLLVTAINMLPMGQLDGGHVLYGLSPKYQPIMGRLVLIGLAFLGYFSLVWWLFAGLGLIFGVKHPPTIHNYKSPSRPSVAMGWAALMILFLSFTPIPFPSPFH